MVPSVPVADERRLLPVLTELARKVYDVDAKISIDIVAGGARAVQSGSAALTVVPMRVHFVGYRESYCRFAVIRTGTTRGEMIPVAVFSRYDCRDMRKLAEADLNHDGVPDFVFEVSIPSNKHPAVVVEGVVYVSSSKGETYCHAPFASGIATIYPGAPSAFPGMKTVAAAIEWEASRRGRMVLECPETVSE
ncbi:hypothetical protein [Pendulispora albinea]|uniref:Uncharacterized protein n=1 Tax=Pendulispora albinea TaxID=2741071 RepID=A0ABZ2MA76_9BACT